MSIVALTALVTAMATLLGTAYAIVVLIMHIRNHDPIPAPTTIQLPTNPPAKAPDKPGTL